MNIDTIDKATDKKYTEFSDTIRSALQSKLTAHQISQDYTKEFDKFNTMKQAFADIAAGEQE